MSSKIDLNALVPMGHRFHGAVFRLDDKCREVKFSRGTTIVKYIADHLIDPKSNIRWPLKFENLQTEIDGAFTVTPKRRDYAIRYLLSNGILERIV